MPNNTASILLFLSGLITAIWAALVMRLSRISVFPDIKAGSNLVKTGPYKYIRHPMYLAVILVCTSFLLNDFSLIRLIVLALLIFELNVKIGYEEGLLKETFKDYDYYIKTSKRLVPFIY